MTTSPDQPFHFLDDRPVETSDQDVFRVHSAYARALAQIIGVCSTPFAIGLFGTWGSGKTSVINLLKPTVEEHGHRWVYLDVWKYARDPVRRWVLFQMEEQLGLKGQYEFEGRSIQSHLEFEEDVGTETRPFVDLPTLPIGWRILLLIAVAGAAFAVWLIARGIDVVGWLLALFAALASVGFLFQSGVGILARLVIRQQIKHVRSLPAVSPEKFGAIFSDMVSKALGERAGQKIVVVFDNLDRCPEDAAVDTLSAIKTFLDVPGCVYLVPCDDEALTTHILRSYKSYQEGREVVTREAAEFAREFLRKFFQLTVRLPEVLEVDYERFVSAQVEAANAEKLISPRVQDVALIAYGRETPRKVKRFVNDFLGYSILAQSLEASGELEAGAVTGHPEFLAKMVVIFQEWPRKVEKIKANPELLRETTDLLRRGAELPQDYDFDERLVKFLRATQDIDAPDNVLPFIYLKRAEHERDPELVASVTEILEAGDGERFVGLMKEGAPDRAENAARIAVDRLNHWARGDRLQVPSAVRVLLSAWSAVPDGEKSDVSEAIWLGIHSIIQREGFEGLTQKFDAREILSFSAKLRPWQYGLVLDTYMGALAPAVEIQDFHAPLLGALVEFAGLFTANQRGTLQKHLQDRYGQTEEALLSLIEEVGVQLSEAGFVSSELAAAIEANFSVQEDELNRRRADVFVQLLPCAAEPAKEDFTEKLVATLAPSRAQGIDALNAWALELLERLGSGGFHPSQAGNFCASATQQSQQGPLQQRGQWLRTAFALWDAISGSCSDSLINLVADTLKQPNVREVFNVLDTLSEDALAKLLGFEEVRTALRELTTVLASQPEPKESRLGILARFPVGDLAKVLPDIVDDRHGWDVEAAVEMSITAFNDGALTPPRFGRLAIQLLNRFVRGAVAQHAAALQQIVEVVAGNPKLSKQIPLVNLVTDLGVELLKQDQAAGREGLLQLAPALESELKRRVAEELIDNLNRPGKSGGSKL